MGGFESICICFPSDGFCPIIEGGNAGGGIGGAWLQAFCMGGFVGAGKIGRTSFASAPWGSDDIAACCFMLAASSFGGGGGASVGGGGGASVGGGGLDVLCCTSTATEFNHLSFSDRS